MSFQRKRWMKFSQLYAKRGKFLKEESSGFVSRWSEVTPLILCVCVTASLFRQGRGFSWRKSFFRERVINGVLAGNRVYERTPIIGSAGCFLRKSAISAAPPRSASPSWRASKAGFLATENPTSNRLRWEPSVRALGQSRGFLPGTAQRDRRQNCAL
jgi:hypothetical protein